jgi:hypothetical protein
MNGAALVREWSTIRTCLLACSMTVLGCDAGETECSCTPTGLALEVCPELASQVMKVELSGSACSQARPSILDGGADAGVVTYDIQPRATGQCSIEVVFTNGLSFAAGSATTPITILRGPGCCSGLYPDPVTSRVIPVCPLLDAAAGDAETIRDARPGS